jgi:4-amino-4-deoxy-L-arabinose transferase-like glycosyltransferase
MESDGERGAAQATGFAAASELPAAPPAPAPPPPATAALASPSYAIPVLLILGVALYLVNLGGYPLYTKGEPREAVTVFDIVHGGGWILPARAGVEIPSKPLLMHWLAALASFALGGVSEFTVRLPSAMLAIAAMLACYLYVRRLYDDVAALFAAVILGTSFQVLQAGTGARVDMTLTFFFEVAFFEFILAAEGLTKRRMPMYVAAALAVLTKGPVGAALPALVAIVWIATWRKWRLLRDVRIVQGTIVFAIIAGSWYAAAIHAAGWEFVRKQVLQENFYRFVGGAGFHEGHRHRFYYVELALLAGFLPWTALFGVVGAQAARHPRRLDERLTYLLTWFAVVLLFYNFAASKRGVYLLALYPALASIVAIYAADALDDPSASRGWINGLARSAGIVLIALGATGVLALGLLVWRPQLFAALADGCGIRAVDFPAALAIAVSRRPLLTIMMPVLAEAAGFYLLRARPGADRLIAGVAAGMGSLALAGNLFVVPAIANTLSLEPFTVHAMEVVDNASVSYLGGLNYDIAYYSRRTIPIASLKDARLPDYLICTRGIYNAMSQRERSRFTVVMTSNPTSLDGSDRVLLLKVSGPALPPRPAETNTQETLYMPRDSDGARFYDARERRSSLTDFTRRGSTSAEPPRRLRSQMRVISESYRLTSTSVPPRCFTSSAKPAAG